MSLEQQAKQMNAQAQQGAFGGVGSAIQGYSGFDVFKTDKEGRIIKPPKKDYNTVAVRFLRAGNPASVYTYRVPKKAKLRLGEEVVVPSTFNGFTANAIAVVVELHKTPQDTGLFDYKFVAGKVVQL